MCVLNAIHDVPGVRGEGGGAGRGGERGLASRYISSKTGLFHKLEPVSMRGVEVRSFVKGEGKGERSEFSPPFKTPHSDRLLSPRNGQKEKGGYC